MTLFFIHSVIVNNCLQRHYIFEACTHQSMWLLRLILKVLKIVVILSNGDALFQFQLELTLIWFILHTYAVLGYTNYHVSVN